MKTLLIFICLLFPLYLQGQTNMLNTKKGLMINDDVYYGSDSLDKMRLAVYYKCTFECDTVNHEKTEYDAILQVGKTVSKFQTYSYYLLDSLMSVSNSRASRFYNEPLFKQIDPVIFFDSYYLNYPEGELTFTGRLAVENFKYSEKMPKIEWQICDSISTISGYNAQMATCHFRGRNYVAWFTTEIPVPLGPWKFSGLPGLIISVYDTKERYSFKIINIARVERIIGIPKYLFITTNRKKYMQMQRQIRTNFDTFFNLHSGNSGIRFESPESQRKSTITPMLYDLIELN